jgi:hypothetical protein
MVSDRCTQGSALAWGTARPKVCPEASLRMRVVVQVNTSPKLSHNGNTAKPACLRVERCHAYCFLDRAWVHVGWQGGSLVGCQHASACPQHALSVSLLTCFLLDIPAVSWGQRERQLQPLCTGTMQPLQASSRLGSHHTFGVTTLVWIPARPVCSRKQQALCGRQASPGQSLGVYMFGRQ